MLVSWNRTLHFFRRHIDYMGFTLAVCEYVISITVKGCYVCAQVKKKLVAMQMGTFCFLRLNVNSWGGS